MVYTISLMIVCLYVKVYIYIYIYISSSNYIPHMKAEGQTYAWANQQLANRLKNLRRTVVDTHDWMQLAWCMCILAKLYTCRLVAT